MRTGSLIILVVLVVAALSGGAYLYIHSAVAPAPVAMAPVTPVTPAPVNPLPATAQTPPIATTTPTGPYTNVVLALGDTRSFYGNLTITPTYVVNDGRCPLGVFCMHFGILTLAFDAKVNGVTTHQTISPGRSLKLGGHAVTLTSVEPLKRMQTVIAPADYRFTFSVE